MLGESIPDTEKLIERWESDHPDQVMQVKALVLITLFFLMRYNLFCSSGKDSKYPLTASFIIFFSSVFVSAWVIIPGNTIHCALYPPPSSLHIVNESLFFCFITGIIASCDIKLDVFLVDENVAVRYTTILATPRWLLGDRCLCMQFRVIQQTNHYAKF